MEETGGGITFRPAWQLNDPEIVRDAKRLWAAEGIPPSITAEREGELCAAAYCDGELAAISTANLYRDPLMHNMMFGYRCMVAPHIRQRDTAWRISVYSLRLLQEWNAKNGIGALGLMISVETEKFEAGLRRPVREKLGFIMHFIGYSEAGRQLRAVWFDDAILDDGAVKRKGLRVTPNVV